MLGETAKLLATLDLGGNFVSRIGSASRGLGTFDKRLDRTQSRANLAGQQIGRGVQNTARVATGVAATILTIGAASLHAAGDFEAQMNTINTIARETPEALEEIGDGLRKMARETGTPLEELTQGYYDLLSAGIEAADAQKVLTASNALAVGGLATTAQTVDLLTTAINTYGGDASKAAQYADEFATAVERGKVTADEIAQSYANVGPLAAKLNIENAELAAGYARLTAGGTSAGEASTQMASAIAALLKTTGPLEKLQKQTGRNYKEIAGRKGLATAFEIMRKDAAKAGVELIDLVGRKEALLYILQTTGDAFDDYNADLEAMTDAEGKAAEQMAVRQQGLNYQLAILRENAKDAGRTIGFALLPKITPLIQRLNEFVQGNTDGIEDAAEAFASIFSEGNIQSGAKILGDLFQTAKDAAPALMGAAKITGEVVKTSVALFNSLPQEIRALAIAGLAINKLTGGLVTNIAGGLISSIVKRMTAAHVGITAGSVVVNGGVGGGGAAGAAGGAARGGLGLVSKMFLVGEAIGLAALVGSVQQGLSEQSTQQSEALQTALDQSIAGKTLPELQTALAGVNQGITDLQSNPLYALVQGEALDNLREMRRDLAAAITARGEGVTPNDREDRDNPVPPAISEMRTELVGEQRKTQQSVAAVAAEVQRKGEQTVNSVSDSKIVLAAKAAETARKAAEAGRQSASASTLAGARTVSAIHGIPAPVVNVRVSQTVSVNSYIKKVTTVKRYGTANGSRNQGGAATGGDPRL